MNKLTIVTRNPDTYFLRRLSEEVGEGQLGFFNPWQDLILPESEVYLVRTTGVYQDDRDLSILESAAAKGQLINPLVALKLFRTKTRQYQFFAHHEIPHLPWELLGPESAQFFQNHSCQRLVVKPDRGQGGWGVQALNEKEFHQWYEEKKKTGDLDYLLQPLVEKTTELRLFFIGSDKIFVLKRWSEGGIANFAQAGEASMTELPVALGGIISKLISLSDVDYGAIDLFWDGKQAQVLELNVAPGIEQLESVSGINIMKPLLKSFKLIT